MWGSVFSPLMAEVVPWTPRAHAALPALRGSLGRPLWGSLDVRALEALRSPASAANEMCARSREEPSM